MGYIKRELDNRVSLEVLQEGSVARSTEVSSEGGNKPLKAGMDLCLELGEVRELMSILDLANLNDER